MYCRRHSSHSHSPIAAEFEYSFEYSFEHSSTVVSVAPYVVVVAVDESEWVAARRYCQQTTICRCHCFCCSPHSDSILAGLFPMPAVFVSMMDAAVAAAAVLMVVLADFHLPASCY